jgi:hypothetical protein
MACKKKRFACPEKIVELTEVYSEFVPTAGGRVPACGLQASGVRTRKSRKDRGLREEG